MRRKFCLLIYHHAEPGPEVQVLQIKKKKVFFSAILASMCDLVTIFKFLLLFEEG
jgi:positive regulator of sigma E activity